MNEETRWQAREQHFGMIMKAKGEGELIVRKSW
jgi:hypothetical protein